VSGQRIAIILLGTIAVVALGCATYLQALNADLDVSPWLVAASGPSGAIGGYIVGSRTSGA
jgi:hypothetical protein